MNKQDKKNMRTSMQKPIIDAEAFIKFFEETSDAKFVDAETGQPAIDILAKQNSGKKSDYDLWLEKQDEETKKAHKMGEF
jgi:hypothetical protein